MECGILLYPLITEETENGGITVIIIRRGIFENTGEE